MNFQIIFPNFELFVHYSNFKFEDFEVLNQVILGSIRSENLIKYLTKHSLSYIPLIIFKNLEYLYNLNFSIKLAR